LDFFLFGVMQGNEKTGWMMIVPVGIIYFLLYYFIFKFLIIKLDLKTPGCEADDVQTKLYTKEDVNAAKGSRADKENVSSDTVSADIIRGLGGRENISDIDCCATRLRCTVDNAALVDDAVLKGTGASGVVRKGNGVQIIYGPGVTVIKSNLEDYLSSESCPESCPESDSESGIIESVIIASPMNGIAANLAAVPDETFASKMVGDGAAVTPQDEFVYAPADGEVAFIFDTKHALGMVTDSGINLMLHIGIDTVKLNGNGFEVFVESGQRVKQGELMLKIDLEYLKEHAPSVITPVLCTELKDNQKVRLLKEGSIRAGEALIAVDIGK
ncbi:MAG: PTS glucose transporter subunit IIA, partial [Lachnospira sp.]|nr:PTS glucose transporter subunit IIA [Lachnospira sp.]